MKETAKDFTEALQEENEETIRGIKQRVDDSDTIQSIKRSTASIRENVDIHSATDSLNKLVLNTVQTLQSSMTTQNGKENDGDLRVSGKTTVDVKPFEKERATYCSDPSSMTAI